MIASCNTSVCSLYYMHIVTFVWRRCEGGYITTKEFADRKRYYDAFDAYYRDGNADDMVSLVGQYVSERLDKYPEVLR